MSFPKLSCKYVFQPFLNFPLKNTTSCHNVQPFLSWLTYFYDDLCVYQTTHLLCTLLSGCGDSDLFGAFHTVE